MGLFSNLKRAIPKDTIRVTEVTDNSDFKCITGKYCIVDNIVKELLTPRRTYVFDPEYGSDIHKYVFDHIHEDTVSDIISEVKRIIDKYPTVVTYEINYKYSVEKKTVVVIVDINVVDEKYRISMNMGKDVLIPQVEFLSETL